MYDVAAVRKDFPIFEKGIAYLDSANTSQRPRQVTGAVLDYWERYNSNIHRAAYKIAEEATDRYEATREKVRAFINAASTKEIINTRGTTEAINLVAYAWGRDMVKRAKAAGATVLVDGAQGAPHQGVDVRAIGCDFYAFSGHKMLGPTGAGILYGRRELLEQMDPFMGGGDMIKTVRVEGTTYHDLPWKFEAGTQAIGEVIGLGAAVDYIGELRMENIREHETEITEYAYEALSEIEGLTVYGPPPSRRAGVISFALDGIHPHDLATIADRDQVCLRAGHHCAMPLMTRLGVSATARASFYVYTQKDEVDRLIGSIKEAQKIFK